MGKELVLSWRCRRRYVRAQGWRQAAANWAEAGAGARRFGTHEGRACSPAAPSSSQCPLTCCFAWSCRTAPGHPHPGGRQGQTRLEPAALAPSPAARQQGMAGRAGSEYVGDAVGHTGCTTLLPLPTAGGSKPTFEICQNSAPPGSLATAAACRWLRGQPTSMASHSPATR